ncbi:hypothetical protein DL98DRAFT_437276 [Cadophora sp. DSE1049]|nr:hypothetical protein DL98DRAFT_437276 [Cadophora sp. DSE1049]
MADDASVAAAGAVVDPRPFLHSATGPGPVIEDKLGSHSPAVSDPFRYAQLRTSFVNNTVSTEVSKLFSDTKYQNHTWNSYFRTVHVWMPVISRSRFSALIATEQINSHSDANLLLLCLSLCVQIPVDATIDNMRTSLYAKAKSLYAMLESAGITTIRTVQSSLLICIYEFGHGLVEAASITIGSCTRAGMVLGIHKHSSTDLRAEPEHWEEREEERRVWCGIVILDRCISLHQDHDQFVALGPNLQDHLPVDDRLWEQGIMTKDAPLNLSTPWGTRVGPFAREVQASHLLGRVLNHAYTSVSDTLFLQEEAAVLNRALITLKTLIPQEMDADAMYCGVSSLCLSALMLLRGSQHVEQGSLDRNNTSLAEVADMIVELAYTFPTMAARLDMESFSPFVPYMLYQAAIVQARTLRVSGTISCVEAYEAIVKMLHTFNERWKIAGEYLSIFLSERAFLTL